MADGHNAVLLSPQTDLLTTDSLVLAVLARALIRVACLHLFGRITWSIRYYNRRRGGTVDCVAVVQVINGDSPQRRAFDSVHQSINSPSLSNYTLLRHRHVPSTM